MKLMTVNKPLVALLSAGFLFGGGVAGAVALTTGTVSACSPTHTVKVDDVIVKVTASQCVTTTYTIPPPVTVIGPTTTVTQIVTVTQPTSTTTPTTPTPPPSGGYGIIAWGDNLSNYSAAHQQGAAMIGVSAGPDAAAAAKLPGRSVLYMDANLIRYDGGSGVNYIEANNAGYLTGAVDGIYPAVYARIDNVAYQQWFAQKAVELVRQYGVDGIWLDDALPSGNPSYTVAQMKPAMKALVQAIGAALHANGFYLMASAGGFEPGVSGSDDGSVPLAWWETLAPYTDGIAYEYFQELPSDEITMRMRGPNWNQHWDEWQAAFKKFHADYPGKDFEGLVYGPVSNHVYGRASLALADPAGIFVGNQGSTDMIASAWATCPSPIVNPVTVTASC